MRRMPVSPKLACILSSRRMISVMMLNKYQLVIVWRVYEPCNLSCHFCEYSRDIVRHRSVVASESILRFGRILSEYQEQKGKQVLINWLGGEPLLWKDFVPTSRMLNEKLGISLSVTTNGTKLSSEEIKEVLLKNYEMITVSVDGFSEFHDFHRGSKGLFDNVRRHIKTLQTMAKKSGSDLRVRVNTVLMRKNIRDFEAFCLEIASWGVNELTINQLGGNERTDFFEKNCLLPEQAEWLDVELPRIKKISLENGLKILGGQKYTKRIIATSKNIPLPIDDCSAGEYFLFINENNKISPCSFTSEEYGVSIEEIENVEDLLGLPFLFNKLKKAQPALPCMDCHSTQVFGKFET